jgi:NTP pyrophosphatase (non-canonical NTP hydrolase)
VERTTFDESNAARGDQSRRNLVAALRECGELADAVEHFQGDELLEVLIYIDGLRFVMAESSQLLQGVVRGFER